MPNKWWTKTGGGERKQPEKEKPGLVSDGAGAIPRSPAAAEKDVPQTTGTAANRFRASPRGVSRSSKEATSFLWNYLWAFFASPVTLQIERNRASLHPGLLIQKTDRVSTSLVEGDRDEEHGSAESPNLSAPQIGQCRPTAQSG